MKGYFERPELTCTVVRGGWFQTGDTGLLTPEGELMLTGRAVDEINKGGLKIQPQDVELAAASCPLVRDVCVFATADEFYGQNVGIALVLDESTEAGIAAVTSWMSERLSLHKMPAAWYQLDALPRTSRGKIQRPAVAALCARLNP
jgi:acyl-CoA synthetase (AMP-forming)/AMP-acid ligase II